jgi:hypothetical protein
MRTFTIIEPPPSFRHFLYMCAFMLTPEQMSVLREIVSGFPAIEEPEQAFSPAVCCIHRMSCDLKRAKILEPIWVSEMVEESKRIGTDYRKWLEADDIEETIDSLELLQAFMVEVGLDNPEYYIEKQLFSVSLRLFFLRTNNTNGTPNPTQIKLNTFMQTRARGTTIPRYKQYVEYLLAGNLVTDIICKIGVISFTILLYTSEKLFSALINESLEDGIYEGTPGNAGIYFCKDAPDRELGLIDYRRRESIRITRINNN